MPFFNRFSFHSRFFSRRPAPPASEPSPGGNLSEEDRFETPPQNPRTVLWSTTTSVDNSPIPDGAVVEQIVIADSQPSPVQCCWSSNRSLISSLLGRLDFNFKRKIVQFLRICANPLSNLCRFVSINPTDKKCLTGEYKLSKNSLCYARNFFGINSAPVFPLPPPIYFVTRALADPKSIPSASASIQRTFRRKRLKSFQQCV